MTNQSQSAAAPGRSPLPSVMKAARLHGRSGVAELHYEDAPLPRQLPGDAIVRVCATGITPTELEWDETYQNADGSPRIPSIPGHELAGIVESVSLDVFDLRPGDPVYGLTDFPRDGAAAEYVAVRAANLAPKPKTIDYVNSAAIALSGLTAWQAFFTHANLQPGQHVLIHGGAGGVGVFAVQLAHWRGARVSVTARKEDRAFLFGLGADNVIDYTSERFEDELANQDLVFDLIGGATQDRSWRVLRKGGLMINLSRPLPEAKLREFGVRGIFFIVEPNRSDLIELAKLVDRGALKSVVSRIVPLARARTAFAGLHAPGKTIIQVRDCE